MGWGAGRLALVCSSWVQQLTGTICWPLREGVTQGDKMKVTAGFEDGGKMSRVGGVKWQSPRAQALSPDHTRVPGAKHSRITSSSHSGPSQRQQSSREAQPCTLLTLRTLDRGPPLPANDQSLHPSSRPHPSPFSKIANFY